ncbi:MAG: pseudouridine synthase [Candidatus Nanopelagicales bacterium]
MSETEVRLQKVLAQAGIGSRRRCEQLIEQGRVSVNGEPVVEQGMRIDPATAVVHVDGQRIPTAPDNVVLVLNKPRGVVTTMQDEQGRACVGDLVQDRPERLFHIGRLDADTEGLLLLTNDGELANRVGHPSHGVDKTYVATVTGQVSQQTLRRLKSGVELDDGPMQVDSVRIVQQAKDRCMLELVIHEGRNRIIRRLLDEVGHPVIDLVRTRIGPIHLGNLRAGQVIELTGADLHALYTAVGL